MADSRQYVNGSLLITPQLCEEHKSCSEGLEFMQRLYPQGFTVDDVYTKKVRHIPMYFVCWGYHFLPFTEEDKKKFIAYAQIVNSSRWILCHHIDSCDLISDSSYCDNSTNIEMGENISNSNFIKYSRGISFSNFIYDCNEVSHSCYCRDSGNIENSMYICNSEDIKDSYGLFNCKNITNSYLLMDTNDVHNAIAAKHSNRIFCTENCSIDFEYAVLNKKVSKSTFDLIYSRLKEYFTDEPFAEWEHEPFSYLPARANLVQILLPVIKEILPPMSKEDEQIFFESTFCPEILR